MREWLLNAYWDAVLGVRPLNRLYSAYLNWRYEDWHEDTTYAEDPLGGAW